MPPIGVIVSCFCCTCLDSFIIKDGDDFFVEFEQKDYLCVYNIISKIQQSFKDQAKELYSKEDKKNKGNLNFTCPISKDDLIEHSDHYFSKKSLISYPKINGIPCLLTDYAVLTTKHS